MWNFLLNINPYIYLGIGIVFMLSATFINNYMDGLIFYTPRSMVDTVSATGEWWEMFHNIGLDVTRTYMTNEDSKNWHTAKYFFLAIWGLAFSTYTLYLIIDRPYIYIVVLEMVAAWYVREAAQVWGLGYWRKKMKGEG